MQRLYKLAPLFTDSALANEDGVTVHDELAWDGVAVGN